MEPVYADIHIALSPDGTPREILAASPGGKPEQIAPEAITGGTLAQIITALQTVEPEQQFIRIDNCRYRLERFNSIRGTTFSLVPAYRPIPLDQLGLTPPQSEELIELGLTRGLVLITGDFGSGKTNLMDALICAWLEAHGGRAIGWGDPCEHEIEGYWGSGYCIQMDIPMSGYPEAAMKTKRSRARYAGFGECRDDASYAAVLDLAMSGPLCVTTAHGYTQIAGLTAFHAAAARLDNNASSTLATALSAHLHVTLTRENDTPRFTLQPLILNSNICDQVRAYVRDGDIAGLNDIYDQRNRAWRR